MISPTRSHSSAPCGCGGAHASTSSSACGCGCGGSCGCGSAQCHDGAIARPLFFAGQLLTEEDLQALSAYVGAKSRLHNRNLFGEGVVCGFEVVCHPCGDGKVIVRPGHALDCCGNDIVLSSAQTLDVNALVRELRKKLQGGIDCGDPCAEPGQGEPRQRYCLYVNYCETFTDPVSAFVTDEPCGTAACQPTRVREGLRFELRCREKATSGGLICQVASCLGDGGQFEDVIKDLTAMDHIIQQSEEGLRLEREGGEYKTAELVARTRALEAATALAPTGSNLRKIVAGVDVLRVHLDRFNKLHPNPPKPDRAEIKAAGLALDAAAAKIVANLDTGAPTPLEKSFTKKVVVLAEDAINKADNTTHDLWTLDNIPDLGRQLDEMLCSLLKRLVDHLAGSSEVVACQLRREVRELGIPCPPLPVALEFSKAIELARRLRNAWWHFLQECICTALLPPCPSCDDTGVLLACVEVEKCEVVKICNLERTFVPTAVALRHWLPLHLLGNLAEALCCREFGSLELSDLLDKLCPFEVKLPELARAFAGLGQLILERETRDLLPVSTGPGERSDLEDLRRELAEQAAKNADLENRLKALEGRKKP